jgi:hypothetical protein
MSNLESPAAAPKRESILGLIPARLRLRRLKAQYRANTYSGHPEEMLDAIDGVEAKIRRIKSRFS